MSQQPLRDPDAAPLTAWVRRNHFALLVPPILGGAAILLASKDVWTVRLRARSGPGITLGTGMIFGMLSGLVLYFGANALSRASRVYSAVRPVTEAELGCFTLSLRAMGVVILYGIFFVVFQRLR